MNETTHSLPTPIRIPPSLGPSDVPPTSGPPAVALTGLTKHFGSVHAVRGLDLTVARGEVLAFLGPNGAGKTTTIDIILGLSEPTSGSVEVMGASPHQAVQQGRVAAVMQSGGLLKDLTVRESIELIASLYGQQGRVAHTMEIAGLTEIGSRRGGMCSGGEQQRVRFAQALISDPDIIILDEPTTGMDVESRRAFWNAIREDAAQGRTVIFATHYLQEAQEYADRVVMVSHGVVVADGTPDELRRGSSGTRVHATWPEADREQLHKLPGVTSATISGSEVHLVSTTPDDLARWLLTQSPAHSLIIEPQGLEDVFIELTGADAAEHTPATINA